MKRLISIFLILCAANMAIAGGLIFGLRTIASTTDAVKVRDKYQQLWGGLPITKDVLPTWRLKANTNVQYYVLCVETNRPGCPDGPLKTITKTQFEAWKDANLDNPNHLQVIGYDGRDQLKALSDVGLEPMPGPND